MSAGYVKVALEGEGPKYKILSDLIRQDVADGKLSAGTKLPTVRDLAYDLGVTPGTVARAYGILVSEGYLETSVGRGTFVSKLNATFLDNLWSEGVRLYELDRADLANLYSPRLPEVGQTALIQSKLRLIGEDMQANLLEYTARISSEGCRRVAAKWLMSQKIGDVDPIEVVLTHGGQHALNVVGQSIFTGAKPVMLVEALTYPGFRRVAELMRVEIVPVDMDEHGVIPEALEDVARKTGAQAIALCPEVHNAYTCPSPPSRRRAVADIARRVDIQIIEDDCYRTNKIVGPSYRSLVPERTWHISSLAKVICPSLRIGFAVAPRARYKDLRRSVEYGYFGVSAPILELTQRLLEDPSFETIPQKIRSHITEYVNLAADILGEFDIKFTPDVPFVWLTLPKGWTSTGFVRLATESGVLVRPDLDFTPMKSNAPEGVRIAINCQIDKARFAAALKNLAQILENGPADHPQS